MPSLSVYGQKLRQRGLKAIISSRLDWYKKAFQMDNWWVGRWVELTGNTVKLDGVTLSVDNPLISTRHKSTLYFGRYETDEWMLTQKHLDRSIPTVELGGSIGGIACRVNRIQNDPSAHAVVECNPVLLPTLKTNKALNCSQFAIIEAAIGYVPELSFTIADHFMLGALSNVKGRTITVKTTRLADILDRCGFRSINLISDIEGTEVDLVKNELPIMRDRVKCLVVETHPHHTGDQATNEMIAALRSAGFTEVDRSRMTVALVKR